MRSRSVVMAIENYGRVYRLVKAHVPVNIEMNVETKFTGDHEHGFDTVAEIPGTDPKLKDEVVMVGGHLDSWAVGHRRHRQRRGNGRCDGSDAHPECAAT